MGRKRKSKAEVSEGNEQARRRNADNSSELDSDSESDYIEDDDGALLTPAVDAQILHTLAEIRAKDRKIYDPETKFFDEEDLKRAEEEWVKKGLAKGQKVTLTDYQRQRLLSGKILEDDEDGEDYDEEYEEDQPLTHFEEQEKLKRDFKFALDGTDSESDSDNMFLYLMW